VSRAFDVFQLAAMAAYLTLLIGRTVHLRLTRGIKPFALGTGKPGVPALLERIFFPALILWWAETLLYAFHSPLRIFPPPLDVLLLSAAGWKIAGSVLLLCACVLFAWALVSFGASWRVGIDAQTPGTLVTGGVFAFSRNPIFLSLDLYFLGTFLINGTAFFLLAAVLAIAGMHYQILQEEKYLLQAYGDAYRAYGGETARYVGRRLRKKEIRTRRQPHVG
jgi:protein-S-isoprenylcysteine O-methyltransferase Ste14